MSNESITFLDFIRKMHEERKQRFIEKHYGPGPHPGTGTPQSIHAGARQRKGTPKKGRGGKGKAAISTKAAKHYTSGAKAIAAGKTSIEQLSKKEFVSLYEGVHGWGIGGAVDTFDIGVEFGFESKEFKQAQKMAERVQTLKNKANERLRNLLRQYASDEYTELSISVASVTDSNAADAYDFLTNPKKYVKRVKGAKQR